MKEKRTFSNGRTLAEQLAFEADLVAEDTLEMLSIMELLDPELLDEWESGFIDENQAPAPSLSHNSAESQNRRTTHFAADFSHNLQK